MEHSNLSRGMHYVNEYSLNVPNWVGVQCAQKSSKRTEYGYSCLRVTNYISIYKTRLEVYSDGTAKAVTMVNCNYSARYQYTKYYDEYGKEIRDKWNRTRTEMNEWKRIRKSLEE